MEPYVRKLCTNVSLFKRSYKSKVQKIDFGNVITLEIEYEKLFKGSATKLYKGAHEKLELFWRAEPTVAIFCAILIFSKLKKTINHTRF